MLCGCSDNVVWRLYQHYISNKILMSPQHRPTLTQRSGNVVWMLYQCCILTTISMLPQYCHNLGQCWNNVQVTLCEHCTNVVFWPKSKCCHNIGQRQPMLRQSSGNFVWMFYQCWCSMLYLVVLGPEWQLHSNFLHICNINKDLYIRTLTSIKIHG